MANINHLINEDPVSTDILKRAGELGEKRGQDVYVVGGYVRDLFLGRKIKEVDLMVIGDGVLFAEALSHELGVKKIVPFPKFSTAKIPYQQMPVEVSAARTETYDTGSRKPKEVIYTDLKGDLLRRDFTVNALAVDCHPDRFGDLNDPHNGLKDLNKKLLITPLDPYETFSEDPLRMMRAAYFASALNFEIHPSCIKAIRKQSNRIVIVKTGLMKYVFPEIDAMYGLDQSKEWHHKDIFYHTLQVVDNAAELTEKVELRFAALVHDIAKPNTRRIDKKKGYTFHGHDAIGERMIHKVSKQLKLSNELRDYLKKMTLLHLRPIALVKKEVTDSAVRRVMAAAGDDLDDLMTLCRADITTRNPNKVKKYLNNFEIVEEKMSNVEERDAMRAFQSPVRGKEIMETFDLKEGKEVGRIKHAIEEILC